MVRNGVPATMAIDEIALLVTVTVVVAVNGVA